MKHPKRWPWLPLIALALIAAGSLAWAKDTLVVDLVNEPASLDPHVQWNPDSYYVYRNIFDNLVTRNNDSKIVPDVATSWKRISDTVTEFKIRTDITFQDGTPLTADDVVFSIKRITDPKFNSPQLGQFNKITDAVAVDPHTVRVTTDGPYPVLLAQLVKLSIVPKHYVEKVGNKAFADHPIGSGPYKFIEWQRGVKVVLQQNDNYWGGTPPFKTVEFRAVPDAGTRVADLQSGQADVAVSLTPDQAVQLKGTPGVQVRSVPTERVAFVMLNTLRPPTDNIDVRRAIAASIDPKLLVDTVLNGYGKVTPEMLTPVHVGYSSDVTPNKYDPAKAKEYAKQAGNVAALQFYTAPVFNQNVVQALQQMIEQIGLKVSITMNDMPTYLKIVQGDPTKGPNLNFGRWSCACLDADGVLYPLFDSHSPWSKSRDPQMDKWLEEARNSLDPKTRDALYQKVLQRIHDNALAVPLYQAASIYGVSDKLQWQPTPDESMFIMRMSWQN